MCCYTTHTHTQAHTHTHTLTHSITLRHTRTQTQPRLFLVVTGPAVRMVSRRKAGVCAVTTGVCELCLMYYKRETGCGGGLMSVSVCACVRVCALEQDESS